MAEPYKILNKQASPVAALFRLAARSKPLAKRFVSPTVAARPNLVSSAKALPSGIVANKAVRILNFLANVPKGERFAQRPLGNLYRLSTFDGIPLMRRTGQGLFGLGLYGLGAAAYEAQKNVNEGIDDFVESINRLPYLKDENKKEEIYKSLHGLKRDLVLDQTLGVLKRKYITREDNPRQKHMDALTRNLITEAVSRNVHAPTNNVPYQNRFLGNRNLLVALINQLNELPKRVVSKPKNNLTLALDTSKNLSTVPTGSETSVERIMSRRLAPIVADFPGVDLNKLKRDLNAAHYAYLAASAASSDADTAVAKTRKGLSTAYYGSQLAKELSK